MLIYEDTKEGFQEDVLNDRIVEEIKKGHERNGLGVRPSGGAVFVEECCCFSGSSLDSAV